MRGMLGDSERLREIIQGPVADLLQKLNSSEGYLFEYALKRMLRKEKDVWFLPELSLEVLEREVGDRRYFVDFVIVSVENLGFSKTVTAQEVNVRASLYGLHIPIHRREVFAHNLPSGTSVATEDPYNHKKYEPSEKVVFSRPCP